MKYILPAAILYAWALAAQPDPGIGSIEGGVFNAVTSTPIRKAMVTLQTPWISLTAETDVAGRFQFTGLPTGTYRLSANQAGFFERRAGRPITIGQDSRVKDARILLQPQSVIAGRILDEDGDAVGGAQLAIFKLVYQDGRKRWERSPASSISVSETGEYRVSGLKAGRYLLRAVSSRIVNNHYGRDHPLMYYLPTYYPNATSEQAASPVVVGVGADIRGVDIRLSKAAHPPRFTVSGRVTGTPPNAEIIVAVVPAEGPGFGGSDVAHPPYYQFHLEVPSGQYTFLASVYSGGPSAFARENVTVAGEIKGVLLTMNPAPEVVAHIRLAENGAKVALQGVRMTMVPLLAASVIEFRGRSDASGKVTFNQPIPPGHYSLTVDRSTIPDGCYLQTVKTGGQEISTDDLDVLTSTELEVIISSTAGTIDGSVLDGDGKPFPAAAVTLIPADGKPPYIKQSTDDDGSFKMTGLRPGRFKLLAWEEVDDSIWQDPEFRSKYESRSMDITVGAGETRHAQLRLIAVAEMK